MPQDDDNPIVAPLAAERVWAQQAKADAMAQYPNDPVAAQWAYRAMVVERAKARSALRSQ